MEISRINVNTLQIDGDKISFKYTLQQSDPEEMLFGPNVPGALNEPGEYEYSDTMVAIVESREKVEGKGNIFKFNVDGIRLIFVASDAQKPEKDELEVLGDADILLFDTDIDPKKLKIMADAFDVNELVVVDSENLSEVEKAAGMKPQDPSSKLKYNPGGFQSLEMPLIVRIVTSK